MSLTTTIDREQLEQLHANAGAGLATRRARAQLRMALADGRICVGEVLRDPPDEALDMRAFEVLELAPGIGRKRITKLNVTAAHEGVNLMRPLAQLGPRSRAWLADTVTRPLPF